MASVALVLSILVPSVGNWWYGLTLAAPAAWFYYFQKGERVEEVGGVGAGGVCAGPAWQRAWVVGGWVQKYGLRRGGWGIRGMAGVWSEAGES
jgi:hypothetical protein